MKIQQIVVTAGRTFNHPFESYSNLRPEVQLTATLDDGEDSTAATKQLQAQAEQLVEDHKNHLLGSIQELHDMSQRQQRIASLGKSIAQQQAELDQIREKFPELKQLGLPIESGVQGDPEDYTHDRRY